MNIDQFESDWAELSQVASEDMKKQAERWIHRHKDVPLGDAMRFLDELRELKLKALHQTLPAQSRSKPLTTEQMDEILGVKIAAGGLFFCGRCKSREFTKYNTQQKRSGDEGMTACITCTRCHHSWQM